MSRLDQQVDAVRRRLLEQRFLHFLAGSVLIAAATLTVVILIARLFAIALPPQTWLVGGTALAAVLAAIVLTITGGPSRAAAAVQIDQTLQLKERFSTALEARHSEEPFARAAVLEAQQVAEGVSIRHRFPLRFPPMGHYALLAVAALVLVDQFVPQMDLLGREKRRQQLLVQQESQKQAQEALSSAVERVEAVAQIGKHDPALAAARSELEALLSRPIHDPVEATRTAQKAVQQADAARQRLDQIQRFASTREQASAFESLASDSDGQMLSKARKALSQAQFEKAAGEMKEALNQFQQADAASQEKMAGEMADLAQRLQQMANDPAVQEALRKQLQQAGADPNQAQQMIDQMQKAAAGDKDAADRVQNMAENLARKLNGGVLPAPEQLAPLMQQVRQMQAKMNAQQMADQLARATQQMALAMKQQCQNAGQSGQQNQSQQGSGSQMASAQQQLADAISQLEAMQQEAQMAGASDGTDQEGNSGEWANNPEQGQQPRKGEGNGFARWNPGGQAAGDRNYKAIAPFTVTKEISKGERDEKGKVQAGWFVKADSLKGESREQFKEVVTSAQHDATDDVEQERIPMQAQKVVRDYFNSMQGDIEAAQ